MFRPTNLILGFSILLFLLAWPGFADKPAFDACAAGKAVLPQLDTATSQAVKQTLYRKAAALFRQGDCRTDWISLQEDLAILRWEESTDAAVASLDSALVAVWWPDDTLTARLYLYLGFFLSEDGRFDRAREAYEHVRAWHERSPNGVARDPGLELYKPLANIYTRLGDNQKAQSLLKLALDQIDGSDGMGRAEVFNDLALANLDIGDAASALVQVDRGLAGLDTLPATTDWLTDTRGLLLMTRATALLARKQPLAALQAARQARAQLQDPCAYLPNAYSVLGTVYEDLGRYAEAHKALEESSLRTIDCLGSTHRREVAKLDLGLARLLARQERYAEALRYCQSALQRVLPGFAAGDPEANPVPDIFYPENTILEALDLKAELWEERFRQERDPRWAAAAGQSLNLALRMVALLRDSYDYSSSKLYLVGQTRQLNERLLRLQYDRRQEFPSDSLAEQALTVMETNRAVLLRQQLAGNDLLRPETAEARWQKSERDLREQRAYAHRRLFEARLAGADSTEVQQWERRLFLVQEAYHHLLDTLAERRPGYYRLAYDPPQARLAEVRHRLPDGDTWLVEYLFAPSTSQLYAIGINRDSVRLVRTSLHEATLREFLALFNNWKNAEEREGDPDLYAAFVGQSRALYDTLLAPVLPAGSVASLIIVPDGLLGKLPFDLLLTADVPGKEINYRDLPYLLTRTCTRLLASASLLTMERGESQSRRRGNYLGIAPDYSQSVLGKVQEGAPVVQSVARSLCGKTLVRDEATPRRFLELLSQYRIVHFYGHAKTLDADPDNSWMAFTYRELNAPGEPVAVVQPPRKEEPAAYLANSQSEEAPVGELSSLLFAHDLYDRPGPGPDLVVLSACETGLGEVAPGEGIMSLSRAFQLAGCPSTVMSLWKVEDQATARLTETFFGYLKQRMPKDEALRQAKLDFLAAPENRAFPFFWAGLVLMGNEEAVALENCTGRRWLWLIGLSVLGGSFWAIRRWRFQVRQM